MLLSKTPVTTENFGQNLNTVEDKENKYVYTFIIQLHSVEYK